MLDCGLESEAQADALLKFWVEAGIELVVRAEWAAAGDEFGVFWCRGQCYCMKSALAIWAKLVPHRLALTFGVRLHMEIEHEVVGGVSRRALS